MDDPVVVHLAPDRLDAEGLMDAMDLEGCGAIASFLGVTRSMEAGERVLRLEFDAWLERLEPVLRDLGSEAIERFGVRTVGLSHRTGEVPSGDRIVAIHVGATHRAEAFDACEWLIDELKRQAPLWKKEVTESGTRWKEGLG